MGKRDHGRLVHEVRSALINGEFEPTRVVSLDSPEGMRGARIPGFKVEKYNDGKSVRLSYRTAQQPSVDEMGWHARQALGGALMRRLVGYHAVLEREGFACVGINSRDPLTPYSLWRRTEESEQDCRIAETYD
jgi:hypothetical protein